MGISDGTVIGITKILDNGPDDSRCNIVLVAEGFQNSEQADFDSKCQDAVDAIIAEPWYPALGSAINIFRLNVSSDESGADDPTTCGEVNDTDVLVDTYFDSAFCANGSDHRCLGGDNTLVVDAIDSLLPQWHKAGVIVNSTIYGGCAWNRVFWTSVKDNWTNVFLHEMGHTLGNLADEYESDRDPLTTEPMKPNITIETSRTNLKWKHLVTPEIPIPTMETPDCSVINPNDNILVDDLQIGLFEGGMYRHCGAFRPAFNCKMRSRVQPFCRVCIEGIADALETFMTATPDLVVLPTTLDFGDVPHGMTMYRSIEITNRRIGWPGKMQIDLSAVSGEFDFAPGTETTFLLPAPILEPFTSKQIFIAFTSTDIGGPNHSGSFDVSSPDDPAGSPISVDLFANSVPPVPVDSVLVIDRSGSMSGETGVPNETKIDHAISASSLYISLLKANDKIGLVRYNHRANNPQDILLNLQEAGDPNAGSGTGRINALNQLNTSNLDPDGLTSIGGGIILGSEVLDSATADSRALVVLTDGIQNTNPDIPEATSIVSAKIPNQRVFAVGLGLNQLEDKLQQIASVTNGVAQITGDLVGYKEFLLQKLYVQILADASDEAFVTDPVNILREKKQFTNVYISEVDVSADFIIVYRKTPMYPKYMQVWLEAPDGTIIKSSDASSTPNVEFFLNSDSMFFRVQFPTFSHNSHGHVGRWKVWVANGTAEDLLYYSVMCKARSNFMLDGYVKQMSYSPGSKMTIVLESSLYGNPVELETPVKIQVVRPDGISKTIELFEKELGVYSGGFDDTQKTGSYNITAEVNAKSPNGNHITRYRQLTGIIFVPQKDDNDGRNEGNDGFDDKDCKEAKEILKKLSIIIEKCCKSKGRGENITSAKLLDELKVRLELKEKPCEKF